MPITLPLAIAAHIAKTETAMTTIDNDAYCAALDALVPDDDALTADERRGCFAEISAHRFMLTTAADRGPWDLGFAPLGTRRFQDGTEEHGPDARHVDRETIEYWAARSADSPHSLLRARYADLAREMTIFMNKDQPTPQRVKPSRELSQRAAQSYLDIVGQGLATDEHHAWIFIRRAVELAIWVHDVELVAKAKDAAFVYNRGLHVNGGVTRWWNIDNLLWDHKELDITSGERAELIDWLNDALAMHVDISDPQRFDPHQALEAAQSLMRRHGADESELGLAALRKAGAAFEAMAAKADAMLAGAWLQSMSLRYRAAGLLDDAGRVDLAILARSAEAMELMTRRSSTVGGPRILPENDDDAEIIEMLTRVSAERSLELIAAHLMAPEAQLRAIELESAATPRFGDRIPIEKVGADGFTTATIGSVEDDFAGRLVYFAAFYMSTRSSELDGAFKAAVAKWNINAESLMAFVAQCPFFLVRSHGLIKAGIDAWFEGDDLKAIHVLVPQVEAAVRQMLIAAGASPMKRNERDDGFEAMGMGAILVAPELAKKLDPTLRLHLRSLYTSPKGHNLRNELAHGLAMPSIFGRGLANWVVHSLLAIRVDCLAVK